MSQFSFRNLFGKNAQPPRSGVLANWPPKPGAGDHSPLPVGRVVKFTENGPESSDAPLFQEKADAGDSASPFAIVQEPAGDSPMAESRAAFDGPEATDEPVGFTVRELASLAPANAVRRHALPTDQVIELPYDLLQATMSAGQPAILLSQLHAACPDLFFEPRNEDEDMVIALPEHKVARLLRNGPPSEDRSASPFFKAVPAVKLPGAREPLHPDLAGGPARSPLVPLSQLPETRLPTRTRFPFKRVGGDDTADPFLISPQTEALEAATPVEPPRPAPPPLPFAPAEPPARGSSEPSATDDGMALPAASPFSIAGAEPPPAFASINPFGSHAGNGATTALPAKTAWPRRFESPFAIVSPGEVPAVIESPFAARLAVEAGAEAPATSAPEPAAQAEETVGAAEPAPPPAVISLRLSELLKSLPPAALGFAPERVPSAVRVELPVEPLLAQLATGRVTIPLAAVIEKIDARYQPAFQKTKPGLRVVVPMREIFDNLPDITAEAPASVPVEDIFSTPFSVKAQEDAHLEVFGPEAAMPAPASMPLAPFTEAEAPAMPEPVQPVGPAAETVANSAVVAGLLEEPQAETTPLVEDTAAEPLSPALSEPFVIVPEPPAAATAAPVPPPILPPAPPVVAETASVITPPALPPSVNTEPPPPALSPAPAVPPVANPFAFAPRQNLAASLADFGLTSPFDEDPVPLESLRDDPVLHAPPAPVPPVEPPEPPQEATPRPVIRSGAPFSFDAPRAATPPPVVQPPPVLPEIPPAEMASQDQGMPSTLAAASEPPALPTVATVVIEDAAKARAAEEETPAAPPVFSFGTPPDEAPLSSDAPAETAPTAKVSTEDASELPAAASSLPTATEDAETSVSHHDEPNETPPAPAKEPLAIPIAPGREVCSFIADILRPAAPVEEPKEPAPAARAAMPIAEDEPPAGPVVEAPASKTSTETPAAFDFRTPFSMATEPASPVSSVDALAPAPEPPAEKPAAETPAPAVVAPPATTAATETASPDPESAAPVEAAEPASAIEDLSFGYVDDPVQLSLRAVFSTDQALGVEDVAHRTAQFPGLRACMVLSLQGAVPGGVSGDPSEDVRHFQERAGGLFEKTASLVRELDPSAREQTFTLRTAKGVISFFAVGDVCLAALHGEPNFQPGVREKLTLVSRALADMLGA